MFNRIPKWVKEMDDNLMDKELLIRIFNASKKPLENPREMNFDLRDFMSRKDAENATHYLEEKGWICKIEPDHKNKRLFWVGACKKDYVINEENFFGDIAEFNRLSDLYQVTFDGWYASS